MKLKKLFLKSLVCVLFVSFFAACEDGHNEILEPTERVLPRYFAAQNGKVYVTLYDGYLACIDTTSMSIVNQVKVGRNPEGIVAANNKLYVANSGGMDFNTETGYDKTVSIVNANNFSVQSLEVAINPAILAADSKGNVYLISKGNYGDVPATLQRIDAQTQEVTVINEVSGATYMKMYNDKLYIICSQYDSNWNQTANCIVYDAVNEKVIVDKFITDGTDINSAYSISVEPVTGNVYISMSDYRNTGDMYIFSPQGKLIKQFDTKGLNPVGAFFDGSQYSYILNNGNWGSNDASLYCYNSVNGSLTDIFYNANQIKLGDIAQDMIIYGSKMYVAVSESQVIFVLNKNGLILKTIRYRN